MDQCLAMLFMVSTLTCTDHPPVLEPCFPLAPQLGIGQPLNCLKGIQFEPDAAGVIGQLLFGEVYKLDACLLPVHSDE